MHRSVRGDERRANLGAAEVDRQDRTLGWGVIHVLILRPAAPATG
jgi:hypothetical protein